MEKIYISELLFADDMVIFGKSEKDLQENMNIYNLELKKKNMKINGEKTKTMVIAPDKRRHHIYIEGRKLEQVEKFKYLGVWIQENGKLDDEINERVGSTGRLFNSIKSSFLGKKEVPKEAKVEVFKKVVTPILIYGCESWTTVNKHKSRVESMEMRFLRKIEDKTRRDHIRNTTFRENLKTKAVAISVQERQLGWLGHITRMDKDRTVKKVFEARPKGKNRIGRPRKTWKEELKEAAEARNIKWEEIRTTAKDRKKWREICKTSPNP